MLAPDIERKGRCGPSGRSANRTIWENLMKKLLATLLLCCATSASGAPEPATAGLHGEIAAMDTALFDAFNRKDLDDVMQHFTKDLEFYHDKGGLMNYEQNLQVSKRMFETNKTLRRTLVPGSLQVWPIKDYGAIQTGEHRFCQGASGQDDCGVFKFLHIWKRVDGAWKLARVVSYGH